MGVVLQLNEEKWGELRDRALRREGWFVPSLSIKYLENGKEQTDRLKDLCAAWLKKNFGREEIIEDVEVLEQDDIDRNLDLFGIRFTFSSSDGTIGESVAFFNAGEVGEYGRVHR